MTLLHIKKYGYFNFFKRILQNPKVKQNFKQNEDIELTTCIYLIKSKFNTVKTAILSIIIIQNVLIYFLGYIFVIGFAWN